MYIVDWNRARFTSSIFVNKMEYILNEIVQRKPQNVETTVYPLLKCDAISTEYAQYVRHE